MRTDNFEMKLLEKLVGYKDFLYTEGFNNLNTQIIDDFSTLINLYEIPERLKSKRFK